MQAVGFLLRGQRDPRVGQPEGRESGLQGLSVAVAVRFERDAVAVELVAVELDDQPVLGEVRVTT